MAFDKDTRNRLASFVADARGVIADEFTEQFQSLYGISAQGDLTPLAKLGHLDEAGLATAALLRERIAYLEKTHPDDKDGTQAAVARLAREQAFTILNRLAAVRMAEKRGLIVEAVGQGYQSKGFKVFETVAGSALGDTFHRYCRYLFCLFDELALDLGVLFDRRSPQALLVPREPALLALLDLLHAADLEPLWAEDETIGWIYQYYNDPDERDKMRKESAAPRNSRELAVRNQFFTPRYVVEFLTDNTLGRLWYEMTKGKTRLAEQCRYLVRRPTEIFLEVGATVPSRPSGGGDNLSQEDLLKQPVHLPHRPLKDPRELRLLDPACGSMHFGLYAFDLFETIYEEAWELEEVGTAVPSRPSGLAPLHDTYESKEAFLRDVPRLVIEHNIHGIDIDPRAVQIAGLALWLRAQKAWQARGVKPADRPCVRRSNIVCAEPMPGSPELLDNFIATLNPPLLGELVKTVFEKMQLASEAGSLLKIEEEIRTAIDTARQEWLKQQGDLFSRKDGSQEAFFDTAEQQVIDALRAYAEQADTDSYQRRLFADDAARGFAFIDLCRKRYDAVVMNPPFGSVSKLWANKAKNLFPHSYGDILGAFIERFLEKLTVHGRVGAITSRTCFFLTSFTNWRKEVVLKKGAFQLIADLGQGVMDEAMVEAAAYIIEGGAQPQDLTVIRAIADENRESVLSKCIDCLRCASHERRLFLLRQSRFALSPDSAFTYWVSDEVLRKLMRHPPIEGECATIRVGFQTGEDYRFLRQWWEVRPKQIAPNVALLKPAPDHAALREALRAQVSDNAEWVPYSKTDFASPWYSPLLQLVNWKEEGRAYLYFLDAKGKSKARPQNLEFYLKPGFSYMLRSSRIVPYVVPSGVIPTAGRAQAFPMNGNILNALAICASNVGSAVARFSGEMFERPKFQASMVQGIPSIHFPPVLMEKLESFIHTEIAGRRSMFQGHEPFAEFVRPSFFDSGKVFFALNRETLLGEAIEGEIASCYGLSGDQLLELERDIHEAVRSQAAKAGCRSGAEDGEQEGEAIIDDGAYAQREGIVSYFLGSAFGRWDIRYATGERQPPALPDPFAPLPVCPPGMLQNAEGLPAEPKDVPSDYPLRISWPGILVDDENHPEDIVARVREAIEVIGKGRAEAIEQEACGILGVKTLRDYFRRPAAFFADHLKRYSKSRRQAPIYWPLSTKSGSYTLWLYYHRLTDQTLHRCLADFLEPKIRTVQSELDALLEVGKGGTRAGELREFLDELHDLRDEIARVIKLPWKPNLNDGVLITASPLWPLFRLPKWQKDLKACWEKLSKGDYDWAHLAYTIWPQRVEKACETDRSIAIAHNREDLCKVEPPKPAKTRKRKKSADEEEGDDAETPPNEMDFR